MKSIIVFATISSIIVGSVYAQSSIKKLIVRDHRNHTTYSRTTVEVLKEHQNDGRFKIAKKQGGIIGNDFFQPEEIGKTKNTNDYSTATDYYPIDGYKRTFCGRLIKSEYAGDGDFNMLYDVFFTDPLIDKNLKVLLAGNLYYDYNHFEGEVKLDQGFERFYKARSSEIQFRPFGCMYGAWVKEWAGDWNPVDPTGLISNGKHKDNNEVHPVEQGWTIEQEYMGRNERVYNLFLAIDNSGKFNKASNYDGSPKKLWSLDTLNGIFAFAFEINRSQKEKYTFNIKTIANKNVSARTNDGNKHFLIFQKDTLVAVNEVSPSEFINTEFFNVGYTSEDQNIIRGFFIIKTKVGKIGNHSGNLGFEVAYRKKSSIKVKAKISVLSIKRLQNNSYRYYDSAHNRLFTYPETVPNGFNEKSVCVEFSRGQAKKKISIAALEKNSPYFFTNINYDWEGFLTDEFFVNINCTQNASQTSTPLGSTSIGGFPTSSKKETIPTFLSYPKPDLERFKIPNENDNENTEGTFTIVMSRLFEITYKFEVFEKIVDTHVID